MANRRQRLLLVVAGLTVLGVWVWNNLVSSHRTRESVVQPPHVLRHVVEQPAAPAPQVGQISWDPPGRVREPGLTSPTDPSPVDVHIDVPCPHRLPVRVPLFSGTSPVQLVSPAAFGPTRFGRLAAEHATVDRLDLISENEPTMDELLEADLLADSTPGGDGIDMVRLHREWVASRREGGPELRSWDASALVQLSRTIQVKHEAWLVDALLYEYDATSDPWSSEYDLRSALRIADRISQERPEAVGILFAWPTSDGLQLTESDDAQLHAASVRWPDVRLRIGVFSVRQAVLDGELERALAWLELLESWPESETDPAAIEVLNGGRTLLLAHAVLSPTNWMDSVRRAAATCAWQHGLPAEMVLAGRYRRDWDWTSGTHGPFFSCYIGRDFMPAGASIDVLVHVQNSCSTG